MNHRCRLFSALLVTGSMLCAGATSTRADAGTNVTIPDPAISTISDPNDALRIARNRIDEHDLPGAVLTLQRYMINHPEEGAVEKFLGDLYFSAGDLGDAAAVYRKMLYEYPLDNQLHFRLGLLYEVENHLDKAIDQFQESLPDVESIYFLVSLHERKGDLAAFREQMVDAAVQHPSDVNAQIATAQLFGALYQPREAALAFTRALDVNPNSLDALQGLGLSQIQEEANGTAELTLARCLSLDPSNYGCLDALGILYTREGLFDQAQAALEHAYHLAPEVPEALVSLGSLADARGAWQRGIQYYEQAIYVWPYGPDPYVELAFDYEEHGQSRAAERVTLEGLLVAPSDARLHYMLGYLYRKSGRRVPALAQFLEAEQSLDPQIVRFAKESADALSAARP